MKIAVAQTECDQTHRASLLADSLGLPLIEFPQTSGDYSELEYDYFLAYQDSTLGLHSMDSQQAAVLSVDFSDPKLNYRVKSSIKSQNIVKAIGIKGPLIPTVLDGTAGLGKDAFLLASLGCKVTLLERSPIVHALLQDGLARINQYDESTAAVLSSMQLHYGEFTKFGFEAQQFDVVYLDPMFPERRKSAKVKKDMALLQQLLGHQTDDEDLLLHAQKLARRRVVVKRAKLSPPLSSQKPDIRFKGNSSRYDVYLSG